MATIKQEWRESSLHLTDTLDELECAGQAYNALIEQGNLHPNLAVARILEKRKGQYGNQYLTEWAGHAKNTWEYASILKKTAMSGAESVASFLRGFLKGKQEGKKIAVIKNKQAKKTSPVTAGKQGKRVQAGKALKGKLAVINKARRTSPRLAQKRIADASRARLGGFRISRKIVLEQLAILEEDDDFNIEESFFISSIIKRRGRNPNFEYFVEWEGYGPQHNSWIPYENFEDESLPDSFDNAIDWMKKKHHIRC